MKAGSLPIVSRLNLRHPIAACAWPEVFGCGKSTADIEAARRRSRVGHRTGVTTND